MSVEEVLIIFIFTYPLSADQSAVQGRRSNETMPKTYFIPEDFDSPPDGPIRLGNIIADPLDPLNTLNENTPVTPLDSPVYSNPTTSFKATRGKMRSGEAGVWAKIFESIDFKIQGRYEKDIEDVYTIDTIDTTFFVPKIKYMESSVAAQGVVDYLKASRWKKRDIFMITGVKVAKGASITLGRKKGLEGSVKAAFNANSAVVPITAGASAGAKTTENETTEFKKDNFILAYQLRKIICKKGKVVGSEAYKAGPDGRMLGDDTSVEQPSVEIESVGDHDATASDIAEDVQTFASQESDDEECVIVISKKNYDDKRAE